jgi:hypothetical protein
MMQYLFKILGLYKLYAVYIHVNFIVQNVIYVCKSPWWCSG